MATVTLTVRGMSCEGCEEIVENALTDVSGVESASADRESETATVEGDADTDALVEAVDFAGYEGAYDDGAGEEGDAEAAAEDDGGAEDDGSDERDANEGDADEE